MIVRLSLVMNWTVVDSDSRFQIDNLCGRGASHCQPQSSSGLYSTANDPQPQMIPRPQMILDLK